MDPAMAHEGLRVDSSSSESSSSSDSHSDSDSSDGMDIAGGVVLGILSDDSRSESSSNYSYEQNRQATSQYGAPFLRNLAVRLVLDWNKEHLKITDENLWFILNNVDGFREFVRDHTLIKSVSIFAGTRCARSLCSPARFGELGEALAGLSVLNRLTLMGTRFSALNKLAYVLRRIKQIQWLHIESENDRLRNAERFDGPSFAEALRNHPSVEHIVMCSIREEALTEVFHTLPKLGTVTIMCRTTDSSPAIPHTTLSNVLRVPSMRRVKLDCCTVFESGLRAISEGLSHVRCGLTELEFSSCRLAGNGILAFGALEHNSSLKHFKICNRHLDSAFLGPFRTSLETNRTLECLEIKSWRGQGDERRVIPDTALVNVLEGIRHNEILHNLTLPYSTWSNNGCDVLRETLKVNTGLHHLTIQSTDMTDGNWRRVVPFLGDNSTLLTLNVGGTVLTKSIIPDTVEVLEGNSTLECLTLISEAFTAADVIDLVGSLTTNTTLKEIRLGNVLGLPAHGDALVSEAVAAVRKNCGLERVPLWLQGDQRDVFYRILRLNKAGRRYLIEDPTSRTKSVGVLSEVNDDLDCLFLHLQENPLLCACGERPAPSRKRRAEECY